MLHYALKALIPAALLLPEALAASSSTSKTSSGSTSKSASSTTTNTADDNPFPTLSVFCDDGDFWYVEVGVGSPMQTQALRVDIAQPYLWFLDERAFPACSLVSASTTASGSSSTSSPTTATETYWGCQESGAYNLSGSSSGYNYDVHEQYFFLDYVYLNGTMTRDDVTLFNITNSVNDTLEFTDIDFILGNQTNVEVGALGLAGNIETDTEDYNFHVLDEMVDLGILNSSAYSLAPLSNTSAKLIFGGVDTDLFIEPLVQFANVPYLTDGIDGTDDYRYNYPIVPLTGIAVQNDEGVQVQVTDSDTTYPVVLSSRMSYCYLPYSVVVDLSVQLNAYYSGENNVWFLKCSAADIDAVLSFKFGNLTIDVGLDRFISSSSEEGTSVTFEDGSAACVLRVLPDYHTGYSILGTSVMQDVYLAVDNAGNNLAMAQANNENYASKYSDLRNSTTTLSTGLPFESSEIVSGTIPFAMGNNLTSSVVLSFYPTSPASDSQLLTAMYTSGVIYTGRSTNSTTYTSTDDATSSSSGLARPNGFDGSVVAGVCGSVMVLLLSVII